MNRHERTSAIHRLVRGTISSQSLLTAAVLVSILTLGLLASVQAALAQAPGDSSLAALPEAPAVKIVDIRVSGLEQVDSSIVLNAIGLSPGDNFTFEEMRQGIRSLYDLGYFSDVTVEGEEVLEGVIIKLVVVENPRIVSVNFDGAKHLDEKTLKEKMTIKENDFYNEAAIFNDKQAIVQTYLDEGYPSASVKAVTTREREKGKLELTFVVEEGKKVRVKGINFVGNAAVEASKLKKSMDTEVKSWWKGGKFKQVTLESDFQKIVTYYKSKGFRDATVVGHELRYSQDNRDLYITITVEEGPRYSIGDIEWAGAMAISNEELGKVVALSKGATYDNDAIEKMQADAYGLYAEHGYIFLNIERQEVVRDTLVDVTFSIQEGQPSVVKNVLITGNQRTKDKVIRRELTVRPGQTFRRSTLMRSQRDVYSLGFFEDVLVDYQIDEPPDIDLIFDVKEKQTGTATAGAGFTSDTGLTGFIELGHNNLFGNGQSVTLHLERGSKRSNYRLSFTEPWFRDTPTSLGIDVFNLERKLDVYDDARKGGGLRVGRPLPWIDYSRLYVSYSLEDVTLKNFDPDYAGGLEKISWPQRTSRVEGAFVRNSTDSPFYPTKGSRFSVNMEFTGGALGGDLSFHKQVVDFRWYHAVYGKSALLVRTRLGWMDAYNHYVRVPDYERFRLGGTTVDFLRGYPDYDIVPDANVRQVDGGLVKWPGGRIMSAVTLEFQFPIADPLRGLVFFDVGDTWNNETEIDFPGFKRGVGMGLRLEIPMLGQVGFDYGYGFDRSGGGKWEPHFIMGRLF